MKSPKKTKAEKSSRRYDLSPGGTIWKNPHLIEKSELSDFTFEPVSPSTTGESAFSWDVSTDTSDEGKLKTNVSLTKQRYIASGASPPRNTASGSSFKTVSISKNTAVTDTTSADGDKVTSYIKSSTDKPSRSSKTPSSSNTGQAVFSFLENLLCCGFDTTDEHKQERRKEVDNDFLLGKIITCHIITCKCTDCGGTYPDSAAQ